MFLGSRFGDGVWFFGLCPFGFMMGFWDCILGLRDLGVQVSQVLRPDPLHGPQLLLWLSAGKPA